MDAQGRGQQPDAPLQEAIYCNKREQKVNKRKQTNTRGSSPQLGGPVTAASRKVRRRWMKHHRANTAAVSLQRGDACRSTAIRVQQPQLGGIVKAASRKIRRRWMKRDRVNTAAVSLQRGDACRSTAIRVQQPQLGGTVIAASRKIRRRWMKRHIVNKVAVSSQRGDACRSTILQANKMPPRQNGDRVFQRALHSAFASKADQLLHKQGAQMTSAHHSKPLRGMDAHK